MNNPFYDKNMEKYVDVYSSPWMWVEDFDGFLKLSLYQVTENLEIWQHLRFHSMKYIQIYLE